MPGRRYRVQLGPLGGAWSSLPAAETVAVGGETTIGLSALPSLRRVFFRGEVVP